MPSFAFVAGILYGPCQAWNVLNNTGFVDGGKCGGDFNPLGKSIEHCADLCNARPDCAAVTFNAPGSRTGDLHCNFKCRCARWSTRPPPITRAHLLEHGRDRLPQITHGSGAMPAH
jgi:hypothetical protein